MKVILSVSGFVIIVLYVIQIGISNAQSTGGIGLTQLTSRLAQIKKENVSLREKLYTSSSLYQIASVAARMGFVEAKSEISIDAPPPLAIR